MLNGLELHARDVCSDVTNITKNLLHCVWPDILDHRRRASGRNGTIANPLSRIIFNNETGKYLPVIEISEWTTCTLLVRDMPRSIAGVFCVRCRINSFHRFKGCALSISRIMYAIYRTTIYNSIGACTTTSRHFKFLNIEKRAKEIETIRL